MLVIRLAVLKSMLCQLLPTSDKYERHRRFLSHTLTFSFK